MQRSAAAVSVGTARSRAFAALSRPHNWVQLAKFCLVGASGYVVNLAVYTALLRGAGIHYLPAAACSFLVAVTNNYAWNRIWTFRHERGHMAYQGLRFLVVSILALGANLLILEALVGLGARQDRRAGRGDRPGDAAQLRRQQALVVQEAPLT